MKQNALGALALLVGLIAIGLHFLQQPPKIGYAETSVLMTQFTEAVKAQKEFEESQKGWDKNLKQINDSLMAAMSQMKMGYDKASPKDRVAMNDNMEKWNGNLQRYTNSVKSMSEGKQKELMQPVINEINTYMKAWGDEHGYDMIFGTTNGGNLLQANAAFNVTSKLLADLNNHYKDMPLAPSDNQDSSKNVQPKNVDSQGSKDLKK